MLLFIRLVVIFAQPFISNSVEQGGLFGSFGKSSFLILPRLENRELLLKNAISAP
jgi:hypothetical protein